MGQKRTKKTAAVEKTNGRAGMRRKAAGILCMVCLLSLCWGNMVFATDYVHNFATGVAFENLKWVAILGTLGLMALNAIKRNYTGVLITLVVGGIVIFFTANPTKIEDIGNTIGGVIFK